MRRLFTTVVSSGGWKLVLLSGALLGVFAGAGWAAYASTTSGGGVGTIKACVKDTSGIMRLDSGNGCLPNEQPVEWRGADSTVRHISLFVENGQTVSTPVLSTIGTLGTISFTGGSNQGVPTGSITYTPTDKATAVFNSPEVVGSPIAQPLRFPGWPDQLVVPWTTTIGGTVWFEMMIESLQGDTPPVTTIHGSFLAVGGIGYGYYLQIDTSDVAGPKTVTP